MNNQQTSDPSLVSIQNELIGEDSSNEIKSSLKESKILIIVCLAMCIVLFFVYASWMSIPVKKHDIQVEYLFSSKNNAKVGAYVGLTEFKNIGIDLDLSKDLDFESYDTTNYQTVFEKTYSFNSTYHQKEAMPLEPDSSVSLSKIIGHKLYKELIDYCRINNLELSGYSNLFYSRHFDNEKTSATMKHRITHNNGSIIIMGVNDFVFSNYLRDSLPTFPDNTKRIHIDKMFLSKLGYKNISESLIIAKEGAIGNGTISTITPNKLLSLLWKSFQMEDITQSYYIIRLRSSSIKDLSLKMKFFGTINCIPFKQDQTCINVEPLTLENDTCLSHFKKGRLGISKESINFSYNHGFQYQSDNRSIGIWTHYGAPMRLKCLVKFNDMENIQTMRLFILAAFFTLALTTMIKSFWKIRNLIFLGITKSSKSLWKKTIAGTTKFKKKKIRSRKKQSNQSPTE